MLNIILSILKLKVSIHLHIFKIEELTSTGNKDVYSMCCTRQC